jgi:phospholipase/carboxylesterase
MNLLPFIERTSHPNPTASVIWLHGLGADGNDFVPIVRELQLPDSLPIRFLFPHAPHQPVTINQGMVMRAWYDISMEGVNRHADDAGVLKSAEAVYDLIAHEMSRGMPCHRIVLAGFSQGGAVALTAGIRYPQKLGGILALSTYLPMAEQLPHAASNANRTVPIFMAHGLMDPVIPFALAEQSRVVLESQGYPVSWHAYPMPHSVCMEEINAISEWLQKQLASGVLV